MLKPHRIPWIVCILILLSLAIAYFAEFVQYVNPCPLCLLQRYTFIVLAMIFIFAAIHNPKTLGRIIYGCFMGLFSLTGIGLAARQVYLQLQPATVNQTCLPGFDYLLQTMHWTDVLRLVVTGSADCSSINWTMLGLSMAEWSLILFCVIFILTLVWIFCGGGKKPRQ